MHLVPKNQFSLTYGIVTLSLIFILVNKVTPMFKVHAHEISDNNYEMNLIWGNWHTQSFYEISANILICGLNLKSLHAHSRPEEMIKIMISVNHISFIIKQ